MSSQPSSGTAFVQDDAEAASPDHRRVRSALGELNVLCVERLAASDAVMVSVRPEDVAYVLGSLQVRQYDPLGNLRKPGG